ncbi:hypothetical protein D3C71_1334350 [compost metagenome]
MRTPADLLHALADGGHRLGQAGLHALQAKKKLTDFIVGFDLDRVGQIAVGNALEVGPGTQQGTQHRPADKQRGANALQHGGGQEGRDQGVGTQMLAGRGSHKAIGLRIHIGQVVGHLVVKGQVGALHCIHLQGEGAGVLVAHGFKLFRGQRVIVFERGRHRRGFLLQRGRADLIGEGLEAGARTAPQFFGAGGVRLALLRAADLPVDHGGVHRQPRAQHQGVGLVGGHDTHRIGFVDLAQLGVAGPRVQPGRAVGGQHAHKEQREQNAQTAADFQIGEHTTSTEFMAPGATASRQRDTDALGRPSHPPGRTKRLYPSTLDKSLTNE